MSARIALERTVELQPRYADAWAALAHSCASMRTGAFNPQPNSLDRALYAAERAVGLDPANQLAHYALAVAHYFRGDLGAFRAAAERALALNTRDGNAMAFLGSSSATPVTGSAASR